MTQQATAISLRSDAVSGLWELAFRSDATDAYHQLYLDGELADVTHSPSQRTFLIRSAAAPREVEILATPWATRHHAQSLPAPQWHHRTRLLRSVAHQPGEQAELLRDDARGGEFTLADSQEIWDDTHPHWGFGNGQLGCGGFGVDGDLAPGFGCGVFGAGPLGFDAEEIRLAVTFPHSGLFHLRAQTRRGEALSAPAEATFAAIVPPPPLASIRATQYDPTTQHLSLEVFDV